MSERPTMTTTAGAIRFFASNPNPDAYCEPNRFNDPVEDKRFAEPSLKISGDADRWDHRAGNGGYTQPGSLFRLLDDGQTERLFSNIAGSMAGVPNPIVQRQLDHVATCDPAYGADVAKALGVAMTRDAAA